MTWKKRVVALCLLSLPALALASVDSRLTIPQPEYLQTTCPEGPYCDTPQDCLNNCPTATSATCIENSCAFTYGSPGGGNPGGGGGNPWDDCPASFCQSYQDCVCQDDRGVYHYGQCIANACDY
jgi:hypothetical protein